MAFERALQRMQERAGEVHIARLGGAIQEIKNVAQLLGMRRLHAPRFSSLEKQAKPFVLETPDHQTERNLKGCAMQIKNQRLDCLSRGGL